MDQKEANIYTGLLVIAIILAIILAYFIISILRHQRRNLQLHKEKIQAEIITLESERKRMASDLHDEVGPVLSAVKMQINSVDTSEEDAELIDKASKHIDGLLERIREISNNLMPTILIRKGFPTALREFAENITRTGKLNIEYKCSPADLTVENEKEIHLFRIAQEVIHNAIKHSQASHMDILLHQKDGLLMLEIVDNGKGFDPQKEAKLNGGHGLGNILSRVEILNGDLYVESAIGKGVKYNIEIPV